MIDLSHLTEEEQGVIMAVLRRDADLKKAEEERIRKLEKILSSSSQPDTELKYLTGEWFYEAKSRRHMDKIHGSEIILASMQRKGALDGSLRIEKSKTPSSRGSDIMAPPKPARCLDALQLQPQEINTAEKENLHSAARSPRTPRHNPFNRASLIVVDSPENIKVVSATQDQESIETEAISPLKRPPAGQTSQTSGSVTSEGSSAGFRPVPKKRTFVSRRTSSQSDSNGSGLDAQVGSTGVVPAPRRSLQRGSSDGSNQSYPRGPVEMPEKIVVSNQVSQFAQPPKSRDENSQQPLSNISRVSSNSNPDRESKPSSVTADRSVDESPDPKHSIKPSHSTSHNLQSFRSGTYTRSDASTDRETPQKSDEQEDRRARAALHLGSLQDSERGYNSSSVGTAMRQDELSLPRSTVEPDPPVSYDLYFIDKSDKQMQKKSNQKQAFKLSTQATSPTGEEEDSIAKVLDWFSRSTDSNDWLNTDDGPEVVKHSDNYAEIRQDSFRKDAEDAVNERQKELKLEIKRSHGQKQTNETKDSRVTGNKETQEEMMRDMGERMRSHDVDDNDESQPLKISHLKSFWEKSNPGPKILIGKSSTPGQKPAPLVTEKDEETVNKPSRMPDVPYVSGIYNGKGNNNDSYFSNYDHGRQDEQETAIIPQKDTRGDVHSYNDQEIDSLLMIPSAKKNNNDPVYSDYLKLEASPQVADRRVSDTEVCAASKLNPQLRTAAQSRLIPESESVSFVKPSPQPDLSQYRETQLQKNPSKTTPLSLLDAELQTRDSPEMSLSRNNPYTEYKPSRNDGQGTTKTQMCRGSSEELKRWDSEERSMQSNMSPKRKEDTNNKDRGNSPHSSRKSSSSQEITADRIKELKSFWEQERNKPTFFKPKALGEGKAARGAKLNKRFTKSEFDLSTIVNDYGSDEDDSNYNGIAPLNQRIDKLSPSLGASRSQFNTLREFWDGAKTDNKGSFSFDNKPKSPKRKEPVSPQLTSQELNCGDPEVYRASPAVEKTRPAALKSSPPTPSRSKSPHSNKNNTPNYTAAEQQRESKRSSKDSSREEKSMKPQSGSGKEARSPKSRKDSFGHSSSRGNSMRRATSMFALCAPDENDQSLLKMDVSPVHSQRKQRQNIERGAMSRRSQEENETLTPRARACVPKDYRHYLGMTDKTSVHTSLAPTVKNEGSEGKSAFDFDLGGPVRSSTPVGSEERYSRKGSKTSQRPLWTNYSSTDTGPESSLSSMSDTWTNSRNSSTRDDDQSLNPVRKALRRAEARPKNLAKSLEDITASLSPRQERRQDPAADMRHISDASTLPAASSPLFSNPDHLKKMSKSVPSFLQEEDVDLDTDSIGEDRDHRGRLMMGNSFTNLTMSSGMTSASSLSGSVMTMYSGEFGNVEVQGYIQFSINYIQKLREFHIFVAECSDLAAVDPKRGRSDPYVKSYLVPDKANLGKRKTSVKKKTLNPTFKEILRYRVRMEYLRTQTLILSVWHHDTFGRNSFLGEVDVDLAKWDFDHTQKNCLALKARTTPTLAPSSGRGEMRVAIRFLPQVIHSQGLAKDGQNTGEIHIWVKECKNLPAIRATIDPYVKCFVLPDTSRKSRQKTRVLRRTVDPAFNHTMVYDGIREADLSEACVELTVWDRDRLASNLLGGLRIGGGTGRSYGAAVDWMDSTPFEVALWERMKACPNEWVEDVLPLRHLSSAKTAFK